MGLNIRVKAVVADHGETFLREGRLALQDMIEILPPCCVSGALKENFWHHGTNLVVTPGEHDIIEATVGLVDTAFC